LFMSVTMTDPAQAHYRILVVDDDTSMREFLDLLLSSENYQVVTAETGNRALDLIGRQVFDLVLVDIRLGDITGLEVLKQVKKTILRPWSS
jgi:two-component system, NtrC family, response regulator PilR